MTNFPAQEQYRFFTLREVMPRGWMKQQMQDDLEHGFAGRLDEMSQRASSRAFTRSHTTSVEVTEASMEEDTPRSWWDGETLVLKGTVQDQEGKQCPVTLVPFGSTELRRTTFQARMRQQS